MRRWLLSIVVVFGLGGAAPVVAGEVSATGSPAAKPAAGATEFDAQRNAALGAIQALGKELKAALQSAVRAGGAVGALGVCNEKAPAITARVSAEQGLRVGRTSLRPRNPENAPTLWQKRVLEEFETRLRAGEDPAALTHGEVVTTATGREYRFMKAIPTGMICLNCHGSNLDPEVQKKLNQLYPLDRATGFKEGDLRGAFVVTQRLAE